MTIPTIADLARAFTYVECEWRLADGIITSEMWAEGLAFGRFGADDPDSVFQASHAREQLPEGEWIRISARARYLATENAL